MRRAQFEALVLDAIATLRRGGAVEDDLYEFKRDWPGEGKARQLAGSANRARGEAVIYVIGIDERTGATHPVHEIDPSIWFKQLESRFDGPAPELAHHVRVAISDTESVIAVMFETDAAPYVVRNAAGGAPECEIPIRVGSGTRSATRAEVLRLLLPTLHTPRIEVLDATLELLLNPDSVATDVHLRAEIYFEHVQPASIFLPLHEAHAHLRCDGFDEHDGIHFAHTDDLGEILEGRGPGRPPSLTPRSDGLELTGSGVVPVHVLWTIHHAARGPLLAAEAPRIALYFGVAGSSRPAHIEVALPNRRVSEVPAQRSKPAQRYRWALN